MTTIVTIKKIEKGAVYQDTVYDYWVNCDLQNHSKIILFDQKPIDLINYLDQRIGVNIKALFVEKGTKDNLHHFQGKIVDESNQYYFTNDFINIRVLKDDIENEKIELNKNGLFSFGRLDIESIEELNNIGN